MGRYTLNDLFKKIKERFMSLYIGKNSLANSPLTITAGVHTLSEMTASTLPDDTIFSTQLEFLEAEVFALEDIRYINTAYYSNTVIGTLSSKAVDYAYSRLSNSAFIPLILYAVDNIIVSSHGRIYNASSYIWDFIDTNVLPDSSYENHSRPFPTSVYRYKAIPYSTLPASMHMIILSLSIAKDGSNIMNSGTMFDSSGSLRITKDSIIVNGVDLASLKYVTLQNIGAANAFSGNSIGSMLSISNIGTNVLTELKAENDRVYIRNSLNEYLFDTEIGKVQYAGSFICTTAFSHLENNTRFFYVTNFEIGTYTGIVTSFVFNQYYAYIGSTYKVNMSNFYIFSTNPTILYYLTVTASGTTYAYGMQIGTINGITRLILTMELIYLGSDGNTGTPPAPFISAIGKLV